LFECVGLFEGPDETEGSNETEGLLDGCDDGDEDIVFVGALVGRANGRRVGNAVGVRVGLEVGTVEGMLDLVGLSEDVGCALG